MSKVLELTDESFDRILTDSTKPVLVDFYAPWCGHCRTQGPIIDMLAETIGDKAVIAKINVDEYNLKASQYYISGIPAILIFKNKNLVEQKAGVYRLDDLKRLLEKYL